MTDEQKLYELLKDFDPAVGGTDGAAFQGRGVLL